MGKKQCILGMTRDVQQMEHEIIEYNIINNNSVFIQKYFSKNDENKNKLIYVLNKIKQKKKNIKWTLGVTPDLFDYACEQQQINFVLFVVINFNDEYYAKIIRGQIIDSCNLKTHKFTKLNELDSNSFSCWWARGFDINSKNTECCVCFENTTDNIVTHCGHIFCRKCMGNHLLRNDNCPYCRQSVDTFRYVGVQTKIIPFNTAFQT